MLLRRQLQLGCNIAGYLPAASQRVPGPPPDVTRHLARPVRRLIMAESCCDLLQIPAGPGVPGLRHGERHRVARHTGRHSGECRFVPLPPAGSSGMLTGQRHHQIRPMTLSELHAGCNMLCSRTCLHLVPSTLGQPISSRLTACPSEALSDARGPRLHRLLGPCSADRRSVMQRHPRGS